MQKYTTIFFDLDRTLWDFDSNAEEALREIFASFKLKSKISSASDFLRVYEKHNERLWMAYRQGKIKKSLLRTKRFDLSLKDFGIHNEVLAARMGEEYLRISPLKTTLIPGTIEVLQFLHQHYHLYVITNGFNEVQYLKMERCGLNRFFKDIFTSENLGYQKPHAAIFQKALLLANEKPAAALMIGDDVEADILGALKAGIDQVYFNPLKKVNKVKATYEINHLQELIGILSF